MKAWELIEREENWCKGAFARDSRGISIGWENPRACKWCLQAAITKAYPVWKDYFPAVKRMSEVTDQYWLRLYIWNDAPERTHAQVLAAMKKADV